MAAASAIVIGNLPVIEVLLFAGLEGPARE
jgi:hypothetical protein